MSPSNKLGRASEVPVKWRCAVSRVPYIICSGECLVTGPSLGAASSSTQEAYLPTRKRHKQHQAPGISYLKGSGLRFASTPWWTFPRHGRFPPGLLRPRPGPEQASDSLHDPVPCSPSGWGTSDSQVEVPLATPALPICSGLQALLGGSQGLAHPLHQGRVYPVGSCSILSTAQ